MSCFTASGLVIFRYATIISAVASIGSSACWAKIPNLRPSWAKPLACQGLNESFLADLEQGKNSVATLEWRDKIFEPALDADAERQYERLTRDYESRERHGLVSQVERQSYISRLSGFAADVLNQVRRYHVNGNIDKAKAAVPNLIDKKDPVIQAIGKPLGLVSAVAAVTTGHPFSFNFGSDASLTARTDVRKQNGSFEMRSIWLNWAMDVYGLPYPKAMSSPLRLISDGEEKSDEKYRFSLSRDLPELKLNSGISYGGTTGTLTASLSKQLTSNLTCIVDSSRPVWVDRASLQNSQETIRLLYGFSF
jgi:hypothetical protein